MGFAENKGSEVWKNTKLTVGQDIFKIPQQNTTEILFTLADKGS